MILDKNKKRGPYWAFQQIQQLWQKNILVNDNSERFSLIYIAIGLKRIAMTDLFRNRYRIPSARAAWWDYANNGAYFVTICTDDRVHFFGRITNGIMNLSEIGMVAHNCWMDIPAHFPFVELGAFVVMPNHVHGIIIIDKRDNQVEETQNFASPQYPLSQDLAPQNRPSQNPTPQDSRPQNPTQNPKPQYPLSQDLAPQNRPSQNPSSQDTSSQNPIPQYPSSQDPSSQDSIPQNPTQNPIPQNKFGPQSKNLASIIRGYKAGVTKYATMNKIPFQWQSLYHDHIIRNDEEYLRISEYIVNNPAKWDEDKYYRE